MRRRVRVVEAKVVDTMWWMWVYSPGRRGPIGEPVYRKDHPDDLAFKGWLVELDGEFAHVDQDVTHELRHVPCKRIRFTEEESDE